MFKLNNFFKLKISKDFLIYLIGNITFAGINILCTSMIARYLSPSHFGEFSLIYRIIQIIIIISDIGLGQSLIKFASEFNSKKEFDKVDDLINYTFRLRFFVSLFICIIGLLFSSTLSKYLLKNEALLIPLMIAFMGGIGFSIFEFQKSVLLFKQQFNKIPILINIQIISIFILLALLSINSELNLLNSIIIYNIIPILVVFLGFFLIKFKFNLFKKSEFNYKKILKFSFYLNISNILLILLNRTDIFYLNFFFDVEITGIYSAALNMAAFLNVLISTITFFILPKVSELLDMKEIKKAFKIILKYSTLLYIITVIPTVFLSDHIILLFFGSSYDRSILIFRILIISIGLGLITTPANTLILKFNKPYIYTIMIVSQLLIFLIGTPIFFNFFGYIGFAYITFIFNLFGLIYVISYLLLYFRKKRKELILTEPNDNLIND
ncbi:MAG: oligosaccharide flippase family protein [Candidatus Lokiarchaeota archaeon]|nr:oligosaccharide flippase family protein [Candidatus Lokiarchaeota archaeon]